MKISKNKYKYVLFDGCHKFYLIKDNKELANIILDEGFSNDIYTIDRLPELYENSCPLRFINTYGTLKTIIPQFSKAKPIITD